METKLKAGINVCDRTVGKIGRMKADLLKSQTKTSINTKTEEN